MKRILHITVTGYLAILLLFGTTSKEFIHLFTHHSDTVHPHNFSDGQTHIDGEHHHCSFLSFTLEPFAHDCQFSFHALPALPVYQVQHTSLSLSFHGQEPTAVHLRGPPAIQA